MKKGNGKSERPTTASLFNLSRLLSISAFGDVSMALEGGFFFRLIQEERERGHVFVYTRERGVHIPFEN